MRQSASPDARRVSCEHEHVLQALAEMVVDFVCGTLGLRPPERYEKAVWLVLLSLVVILVLLAVLLRR